MDCQNKIVYTVKAGDSLYKLSRQYHTTVTELILGNSGVNPYNLQIGMQLTICPGDGYIPPNQEEETPESGGQTGQMPDQAPGVAENSEEKWKEAMRLAWLSHVYWSRMFLMSVDADAKDQQAVEERVLQTADEITDVFADFLPINATRQLRNLLTEHIEIAGEIMHAIKSGEMENYDNLMKNWYGNANQLATFLGNQNPYFGGRETRNMLLNHLDLTREEIEQQMNGEYEQSIDTFRDLKNQALEMADYFAKGLLAR